LHDLKSTVSTPLYIYVEVTKEEECEIQRLYCIRESKKRPYILLN
jgi:hypothetical protein